MRIGFYTGQLGLRGTDQFCWNLAHYSEQLLGHRSFILTPERPGNGRDVTPESAARFRERFHVELVGTGAPLDAAADRLSLDAVYIAKWGRNDGITTARVPCIVHAIFACREPHGDLYLAISDHMARQAPVPPPVLPFIVALPAPTGRLRPALGIPPGAFVFARHGGWQQFDVPFVQQAVREVAAALPAVWFLFMHTAPFMPEAANVRFLPGSSDPQARADFVGAADAMVHGRSDGETFGLACAEFSLMNKPVVTTPLGDQAHVDILGPGCLVGRDAAQVAALMRRLVAAGPALAAGSWDAYARFTPGAVCSVFQGLLTRLPSRRL